MQHRMQELYDISVRDSLTGLLNRRGGPTAVKNLLAAGAENCAVLLVDIDGLKLINDLSGHVSGDVAIARTGDAIRESIRQGDICTRLGGDEFLVFAPDCKEQEALAIARRILGSLANPAMPLAGTKVSASIGVALHEGTGADFDRMYHDADAALYEARTEGKGRVGVYAPPAGELSRRRLEAFAP